jgi:DNA (cytosine-5)-methyltransferase 1
MHLRLQSSLRQGKLPPEMDVKPPKVKSAALDLFSGVGGVTCGLQKAGFRVIGAVENDAVAATVYAANHPGVRVWNVDIRQLSPRRVAEALGIAPGTLSLIAACPPCQGFSTLRTKRQVISVTDPRNDLLAEVTRFVKHFKPESVMVENVPALTRDPNYAVFLRELELMRYSTTWKILDAADYGVPQRRRRLVLLASRVIKPKLAPPSKTSRTVRDAIGSLSHPALTQDALHASLPVHSERVQRIIKSIPRNGGSRAELPRRLQLACHLRTSGFGDVYGRMRWDYPAPTITSGCCNPSKGRFLHPSQNPAISLREAALLQTFPKRYKFPIEFGRTAIAVLIGNAFPPEFVRRQALVLLAD